GVAGAPIRARAEHLEVVEWDALVVLDRATAGAAAASTANATVAHMTNLRIAPPLHPPAGGRLDLPGWPRRLSRTTSAVSSATSSSGPSPRQGARQCRFIPSRPWSVKHRSAGSSSCPTQTQTACIAGL